MRRAFARIWESPTATTWASLAARTLALVLVLPLVLHRFSPAEFTVWSLFTTIISFQMLAELGFGTTFARVIAYAMGGAERIDQPRTGPATEHGSRDPNWDLLGRIIGTMRVIYSRLTAAVAVLLLLGGTLALLGPVQRTAAPTSAWWAWGIVLVATLTSLRANLHVSLMQGVNQIAVLRRWETWFSLAAIASSFIVLSWGGGLLALTVASQSWVLLSAWRNGWLTRKVLHGRWRSFPPAVNDSAIMNTVWPSAWRSGLGAAMSFGLIQMSGIVVGQSKDTAAAGSYLLGLRLVQAIVQVSAAPFYSKLPVLGRLYAEHKFEPLVALAGRGMRLAFWSFVVPFCLLGLFAPGLLAAVKSKTTFPSALVWGLLGAGYFVERYGAMHIQLYSLSNHIVWHIANGVTGILMVGLWWILNPLLGIAAFPLGMLVAYLCFYTWYSSRRSHVHFSLAFPFFDLKAAGLPLLALLLYLGGEVFLLA